MLRAHIVELTLIYQIKTMMEYSQLAYLIIDGMISLELKYIVVTVRKILLYQK